MIKGKNDFANVSKNLDTYLKLILLDPQNNYIEHLSIDNIIAKDFNILASLRTYFLYPIKFLITSANHNSFRV